MFASAGANSIFTFDQSASISSARSSGSEVMEPWPISAPVERMVTVPSGAMLTQALIFCVVAAFAAEISCRPSPATAMAKERMPDDFRNVLRSMSRLLRRALDGGDDAVVRAAAADVAVHVADDVRARGLRIGGEELRGFHDLSRLAVAALRHLLGDPRFLQRMRGIGRQAFDRRHLRAFDGADGGDARAHRLAVDVHGARATLRDAAAVFRPGELQLISDHPEKWSAVLGLGGYRFAVESESNHRASSLGAEIMRRALLQDRENRRRRRRSR